MQLSERTVLITGGASGLGAATARMCVAAGARVALVDLDAAAGEALAAELGDAARAYTADVADEASLRAALDAACGALGPCAAAVLCAGRLAGARVVGRDGPHSLALFESLVRVNLTGTFNALRLAAAQMTDNAPGEDGERGVIVTTSSIAATEGQIGQAAYAASKAGVAALALPAARELGRFGIRVVSIAPGMFDTPMMAGVAAETRRSLEQQVPFPSRLGRPEEFAALVRHVLENPLLNGTVLRLDGGLRMGS